MKHLVLGVALFLVMTANSVQAQTSSRIDIDGTPYFMSGMNLAWIDFANDMANDPLDENKMRKAIQDIRDAGGNAMRWWLFTNASKSPEFDGDGLVSGIGSLSVQNVIKALDIAEENGVVLSLCLLSFDLMQQSQIGNWNHMSIENNKKMLQTDEGIQAFIDNALIPLVTGVGDHPAIMTWEVFNEPEGMTTEFGWTPHKVSMADVQKVTNRVAGAIKTAVPGIPVSSGTHSFYANSDVPTCGNCMNYYRDDRLIAAGGVQNGTLDFYQVHYYPQHFNDDRNPFVHAASHWGLDKPIVIGEFPAGDWLGNGYRSTMTNLDAFKWAYEQGYAGAMSWDYNGFTDEVNESYMQNLSTSTPGIKHLYDTYTADIKIKDVERGEVSGNGVMQVQFAGVDGADGASLERQRAMVFTGATHLTVKVRVQSGDAPFSFRAVLKTGSGWDWRQTETFCEVPAGAQWTECSFALDDFAAWDDPSAKADLGNVRSIIFQTFTAGYTGVVQFDDVYASTILVDDFNEEFDVWTASSAGVTSVSTAFVEGGVPVVELGRLVHDTVQWVANDLNSPALQVYSAQGKWLAMGTNPHQMPAGVYIVSLRKQGVMLHKTVIIQ
jgi:hypothetical protein